MFSKKFLDEVNALYPDWKDLHEAIEHNSGMVGRYLDDASWCVWFSPENILEASSLEELQAKAKIEMRKRKLYKDYMSGKCYESEDDKRAGAGCPRLYGQNTGDRAVLDAFRCYDVFGFIPDCKKFKTGECWKKFDELGLKMH